MARPTAVSTETATRRLQPVVRAQILVADDGWAEREDAVLIEAAQAAKRQHRRGIDAEHSLQIAEKSAKATWLRNLRR